MAKAITVKVDETYNAEIVRNESIRLYGTRYGKPFDRTFKMGDYAEYDSYNLSYYGEIVGITDKSVTIKERYSDARKHRLNLYKFSWRNWDFDLGEKQAENAETSMYI